MRKTWIKRDNIYHKPLYKQKLKFTLFLVVVMGISFFIYQLVYISQLLTLESNHVVHETNLLKLNPITSINLDGRHEVDNIQGQFGKLTQEQNYKSRKKTNSSNQNISEEISFVYPKEIGNAERDIFRGIRVVDLHRYSVNKGVKNFRCFTSLREIPWEWVNDDYCDCPDDGSDEPSTSACSRGRFYCKFQRRHNTGRGKDMFISSGRVNDGICDCCDGSDEWLTRRSTGPSHVCGDHVKQNIDLSLCGVEMWLTN
ncbi:uncharacterized protein LOC121596939 [Anopheles merus]|uniref:uncharacterized protein LOC121596939 n=1 Tax=Anopheles merus TaxID=30066 RepID=UPI001BE3E102|nr:uncharacterized protein LOC121596939 [Anopheles merus]